MERMNEVRIQGNVGKITKNEKSTYIAIALNESYKKKDSTDWVDNTVWVDTICFGPLCEKIEKQGIQVGDTIWVAGKLNQREYEGKRYLQVMAQKVQLVQKSKKRSDDSPDMPNNNAEAGNSAPPETRTGSDDKLPF